GGTLMASKPAIISFRWLVSSFGMASLGKAIAAFGLFAVGVSLVAGDSGIDRPRTLGRAAHHDHVPAAGNAATAEKQRRQELTAKPRAKESAHTIPRESLINLLDEARRRAVGLTDARSKARILLAVATGYAKLDDRANASLMFDEAVQVALLIENHIK